MRDRYIMMLGVVSVTVFFAGCTLRPLTYDYHPFCTVSLDVDWSQFEHTPTGMTAMFFNENGSEPTVQLTNDVYHTKVLLREGMYNVILFNQSVTEFGSLDFRGMDRFETAEVYVADMESEWYKVEEGGYRLGYQPEPFAVAVYRGFEVTEEMVDAERDSIETVKSIPGSVIKMSPQSIVAKGSISIYVQGIHNLRSVRASLSGVAEDVWLSTGIAGETGATHLIDGWKMTVDKVDYKIGSIYTNFKTFGHKGMILSSAGEDEGVSEESFASEWEGVTLDVSVLLVDNKTVLDFSFDVSDYVIKEGEIGNIVIKVDIPYKEGEEPPISLPDVKPEEGNEGGFNATVDDWGDEVNVEVGV